MKDAYYFKHDANARSDPKLKAVLRKYGTSGYGKYWILIENLREATNYRLEFNAFILESLAEDMRCTMKETKDFIEYLCSDDLELIVKTDKKDDKGPIYFYSMSLMQRMRHLEEVREKRVAAGRLRWGGNKEDAQ